MFVPRSSCQMPMARKAWNIVVSTAAPSTMAASTTWPLPVRWALDQPARHAEGEQHAAAAEVADQVERRHRRPAAPTDRLERAGERDVVDVVAGGLGVRAVLAPAGHAPVDEPGVAGEAGVGAEAEPLHDAGAEALDEAVGLLDERQHGLDAVGVLEVDADRAPPAVEHVGRRSGRVAAADVLRPVDADHVGAHVGQHHGAERTGADAGDLDDLQALEGSGHQRSFRVRRGCGRRAR